MTDRPEVTLKPDVGDPMETKVTPVRLDRPWSACPHGLPYIVVDGEQWHHADGADEFTFVPCALELLPAKGAR